MAGWRRKGKNINKIFSLFCFSFPVPYLLSAICYLLFSAGPAMAAYEDIGLGARAQGMGNALTGIDADASAIGLNPAGLGGFRKAEFGIDFLRTFRTPAGDIDLTGLSLWGIYPSDLPGRIGIFGIAGREAGVKNFSKDKEINLSYGTWQFKRTRMGVVDIGGSLKMFQRNAVSGGGSAFGAAVDFGALLRMDSGRSFGLSLLNVPNPDMSLSGKKDKAPVVIRVGAGEQTEDYTLSVDFARRSASTAGESYTLSSGFEYWWATYRRGTFGARTGLNLGNRTSAANLGVSYKYLGGQIHYAVILPLTRKFEMGQSVSLMIRFGERTSESECERLLRQEMHYRSGLLDVMRGSEGRENALKKKLETLQMEADYIKERLDEESAAVKQAENSKARLEKIFERQKKTETEAKENRIKQEEELKTGAANKFKMDWDSYLRLKAGGASEVKLKSELERILREYQNAGIDTSHATIELRSLAIPR